MPKCRPIQPSRHPTPARRIASLSARKDLGDADELDVECAGNEGDCLVHQRLEVVGGEGTQPELGDERLLARPALRRSSSARLRSVMSYDVDRQPRFRRV